jgi:hypothetical protein
MTPLNLSRARRVSLNNASTNSGARKSARITWLTWRSLIPAYCAYRVRRSRICLIRDPSLTMVWDSARSAHADACDPSNGNRMKKFVKSIALASVLTIAFVLADSSHAEEKERSS